MIKSLGSLALLALLASPAVSAGAGKRIAGYSYPAAYQSEAMSVPVAPCHCPPTGVPMCCGHGAGCMCVANARYFGYFPTIWRTWPCEPRPDKAFPQAIGTEPLPVPAGRTQVPPPVYQPPRMPAPPAPDRGYLPPATPSLPGAASAVEPVAPPAPPTRQSVPGLSGASAPPAPVTPPQNNSLPAMPAAPASPTGADSTPPVQPPQPSPPASLPQGSAQRGPDRIHLETSADSTRLKLRLPAVDSQSLGQNGNPQTGSQVRAIPNVMEPDPSAATRMAGTALNRYDGISAFNPAVASSRQEFGERSASGSPASQALSTQRALVRPQLSQFPEQRGSLQLSNQWVIDQKAAMQPGPQTPSPAAGSSANLVQHVEPISPSGGLAAQLDGYCPVELVENEKWTAGKGEWSVVHRGRRYHVSGPEQQKRFLSNPDRYAPVFSGLDPVVLLDEAREAGGKTDFCLVYDGRLYAFSNRTTLAKFRQNPRYYADRARQSAGT